MMAIDESGADDVGQSEPSFGVEPLEIVGRPLLAPQHHEHVQVRELSRVGLVSRPNDGLHHEEPTAVGDSCTARAEDLDRCDVVPIVDYALEQVGVRPAGHRLEEAAAYNL